MIYKGDSGTYIVPEHVWNDKNWAEYDAYNDGAGPVTTGPWRLSYSDNFRRVLDRVKNCDDYWGCATGFVPFQEVERYVLYNIDDDTQFAQAMITNQIDETHDLRVLTPLRRSCARTPTRPPTPAATQKASTAWFRGGRSRCT